MEITMSFKVAVATVVAISLASCAAPSASNGVAKASAPSSGLFGMSSADPIKVDGAGAFKSLNKVAIGSFTVGFTTYQTTSAKSGMRGGGGTAARNTLSGIDDSTMHNITDEAYKQFVADLSAKGYAVVDHATLMQNSDFAGTKSYPNPYENESGGLLESTNKVKYFAPSDFSDIKFFAGDVADITGGLAWDNPLHGAAKYYSATGTKVLHVAYLLNFASNTNATGGVLRLTTSVAMAQGLTAVPTATKISVTADEGGMFNGGNGSVTLGQPITSEKEFASVKDGTSATHDAVEGVGNVLAGLSGIGGGVSSDYTFTARPNDYKAAVLDTIQQVNKSLVSKMSELK
jgi:hypothetical protein